MLFGFEGIRSTRVEITLPIAVRLKVPATMQVMVHYASALDTRDIVKIAGNIGGALMATVTVFIVSAYGWNSAFYAVSALSMLGALLFTQIDAGRKLAPDTTSPVV